MKLTKLRIDSYRHLEGINFDFTYPEGHAKAGLPLEKICLIGQSATGKTGILELVKDNVHELNNAVVPSGTNDVGDFNLGFKGLIKYLRQEGELIITETEILKNGVPYTNVKSRVSGLVEKLFYDELRHDKLKLLYLSSEIISRESIAFFNQNPLIINSGLVDEVYNGFNVKYRPTNFVIEFLQEIRQEIWVSLFYRILEYRKRFTQMASELINKGAIGDIHKLNKEYSKWAETNENPLIAFAKYFNPILNKLNLEVDLVNTEYSIPIKSKLNDEVIPISSLSTGTKGLLLSMFPLFEIDTDDSIILVDEPERSLFPDMQIDLIGHYQKMAPNAQFIVATHSPFIAAAFEPEERFILYFDEKGKVAVRRGESPIGDDPNDMLKNDFKINYYNEFGKKAYQDYLDLKRKVAEEPQPEKKKELIVELAALGDKYNF